MLILHLFISEMYSLYRNLYSKFFEHLDSDDLDKVKRFFSDQVSQLLKFKCLHILDQYCNEVNTMT